MILQLHDAKRAPERLLAEVQPLSWAHVVAPRGRRVKGCDWENFSRRDALEALADATQRVAIDPQRVWLAGVGAGGHGAWRLAALQPDRYAAVATTGAWIDYETYGNSLPEWRSPNQLESLLRRCTRSTALLPTIDNLAMCGICLQHRGIEPEVPLKEAQVMREALASFHGDFAYRELFEQSTRVAEEGLAGGPTARFFLSQRELIGPHQLDHLRLTTRGVGDSWQNRWMKILQQQQQYAQSRVELVCLAETRQLLAVTENVAALAVDVTSLAPGEPLSAVIDGQPVGPIDWPTSEDKQIVLVRRGEGWKAEDGLPPGDKSPQRSGGFRSVWDHRVILVYGTQGSPQENAWAEAKARFDAETFLVRAYGVADVVADVDFRADLQPDRNVLVYGNADTNSAWPQLLSTAPVQVRRGQILVGERPEMGDDLACLMVYPRPRSDRAVVGVVGGSGYRGMRATDRLPYFVNGVVLPDLVVFGADSVEQGTSDFRAAGFFGNDWGLETGEIAWRDAAL